MKQQMRFEIICKGYSRNQILQKSTELKACGIYIQRREQQRLVQFLTALSQWF
jgi:biotin operon repressor